MSWSEEDVLNALARMRILQGDTTSIEVKRASGGLPETCVETLCAFANMPEGGVIILGVDERSGFTVTGVENPSEMARGLTDQARNAVSPSPHVETQTLELDGKHVVVAEVSPLPILERPAIARGKAFLRQSDGDYAMQAHELRMLERQKLLADESKFFDRELVDGATLEDLVPELLAQYIQNTRQTSNRLKDADETAILRQTGVIGADGRITLAGLYCLGNYPQGQFPLLSVTISEQLSNDPAGRSKGLKTFDGPVPVLLEEVMDWARSHLSIFQQYTPDGHMRDVPEIPLRAVREVVANALVHRDLSPDTLGAGKAIQIRLTRQGLFVQSPGGLKNVSAEQLRSQEHTQVSVNPHVYRIAKNLQTSDGHRVIEGEGGGIPEMFKAFREAGLNPPVLVDKGVQFTVYLWRKSDRIAEILPPAEEERAPALPETSSPESAAEEPLFSVPKAGSASPAPVVTKHEVVIRRALASAAPLGIQELSAVTGINVRSLHYALKKLTDAGAVTRHGGQGDRTTRYTLS